LAALWLARARADWPSRVARCARSQACPHAAGVAALILGSIGAAASPDIVRTAMLDLAVRGTISQWSDGSPNVLLQTIPPVEIIITTDDFPEELSWVLSAQNSAGAYELVASFDYVGASQDTLYRTSFALKPGTYKWRIDDSYGDGIDTPGSYALVSQGTSFATPSFDDFHEIEFEVEPVVEVGAASASGSGGGGGDGDGGDSADVYAQV
jgi:hypothetical protein